MQWGRETTTMLNKYEFEEWLFELQLLCVRRKAESDEERFAYLIKTLPNSYKRIVMDVYNSEKKETDGMFKEAFELLKEKVAKRGQK